MQAWPRPEVPRLPVPDGRRPRVHDTASAQAIEVGPESGTATLYVCGITPYDATHLGHAATYLAFDLLQRVWLDAGLDVAYAQNVTDVDDPLLERATAIGRDWVELAAEQVQLFRDDMTALRILPPRTFRGVVESMPLVEALVQRLREAGAVYAVADEQYPDLYFRCRDVKSFGYVAHLPRETALALFAERGGDPDRPGKEDPFDCLMWRLERPDDPAWDSPLGRGRPGWHVECTAIAQDALGDTIDVQGGGSDLAFPHHEMCAAEGAAATGQPFARAFVHAGMVALDGEKMSKSKGNLEFVSRLREQGADPMAIRLALLDHHYRSDWEWTPGDLVRATERLAAWRDAAAQRRGVPAADTIAAIRDALRDDLDARAALRAVDIWAAASMDLYESDDPQAPAQMAQAVDALLGVAL